MVRSEAPQLRLAATDLTLEVIDHAQAGGEGRGPGLRDGEPLEQLSAALAEEVGHGHRMAEGDERGVDAVLERDPMTDQVEPEAGPLTGSADRRVGQPDPGHEVPTGQFSEHFRVDLVGLRCERGEPLDLDRVGHLDIPVPALQLIVDEPRTVHRLDDTRDRLAMPGYQPNERAQGVGIGAHRCHLDRGAVLIHHMNIEPLAR